MSKARAVHGHRRGLAPLTKRLTAFQQILRRESVEWRKDRKSLAKIAQKRAQRKEKKT